MNIWQKSAFAICAPALLRMRFQIVTLLRFVPYLQSGELNSSANAHIIEVVITLNQVVTAKTRALTTDLSRRPKNESGKHILKDKPPNGSHQHSERRQSIKENLLTA